MDQIEFLRAQAKELRNLADAQAVLDIKTRLFELADRCEQLANHMQHNGTSPLG